MKKVLLLIAMFGVCASAIMTTPASARWDPCKRGQSYVCE